ncbi:MAG: hypothetical protein IJX06_01665 [Clostridia bacterium]|nr:hypothetical protein [Clostridia bacterium]
MLRKELTTVSNALASKTNSLAVRANYGTGILSSVFGALNNLYGINMS